MRVWSCVALALGAALATTLASCGGESAPVALDEPLRVQGGAFKRAPLPGAEPSSGAGGPQITAIDTAANVVYPFQTGKVVSGRTSKDAVTVGLALPGLGTGYWVLPVEGPDPTAGGELAWLAQLDFGPLPAGIHPLRIVAFDASGNAGEQREVSLCAAGAVPDNLNACDPTRPPPAAVLSLTWDANADVDLVVTTPTGEVIDAKRPIGGGADGGTVDKNAPYLDRDSNGACVKDGLRRESLVFPTAPPLAGPYGVYVRMFDNCGAGPTRFDAQVYEARTTDGRTSLELQRSKAGVLLPIDARGGRDPGLFVTEVTFSTQGGPS